MRVRSVKQAGLPDGSVMPCVMRRPVGGASPGLAGGIQPVDHRSTAVVGLMPLQRWRCRHQSSPGWSNHVPATAVANPGARQQGGTLRREGTRWRIQRSPLVARSSGPSRGRRDHDDARRARHPPPDRGRPTLDRSLLALQRHPRESGPGAPGNPAGSPSSTAKQVPAPTPERPRRFPGRRRTPVQAPPPRRQTRVRYEPPPGLGRGIRRPAIGEAPR